MRESSSPSSVHYLYFSHIWWPPYALSSGVIIADPGAGVTPSVSPVTNKCERQYRFPSTGVLNPPTFNPCSSITFPPDSSQSGTLLLFPTDNGFVLFFVPSICAPSHPESSGFAVSSSASHFPRVCVLFPPPDGCRADECVLSFCFPGSAGRPLFSSVRPGAHLSASLLSQQSLLPAASFSSWRS